MSNPESQKPPAPPTNTRPPRNEPEGDDDTGKRSAPGGTWLLFVVVLILVSLYAWNGSPTNRGARVPYSFFKTQLDANNVAEVKFYGEILTGKWKKIPKNPEEGGAELPDQFNTVLPPQSVGDDELVKLLEEKGAKFEAESQSIGLGTTFLLWMLGPLMIVGFFWFMMRRQSDPLGSGMLGNFVRSPAKRFRHSTQQTTFDDVAAMENAKMELQEIVEFLKTPERFEKLGAQIPKGVLLIGPPGTGKTLLARATAGEAGVPFFSINGSEFIQMFVGVGASRVRDLFKTAKDQSPCILFIDEIDAVGRIRGAGLGGGHDEREQTLNQILSEMDGFQQNEAVIVLAATNRPDVLDPALLRPGRFDRHVTIDRPTREGREAILKIHSRKVPLADTVDLAKIAAATIGFSGAELKNLVNEAALEAARKNRKAVTAEDFDAARDRVLMGPKREEILTEHEREMVAFHEAGHALLAWYQAEVDTLHRVTIVPRGRALGVTQLLPDEERYNIGERRLHAQLAFMLGGRAAEKLMFDEYSAGAEDDLKRATQMARRMVANWGMSEKIGPVAFRHGEEHPFLGKEIHEQRDFSEETAHAIDEEIQRFLRDAASRATSMLEKHRDQLVDLSKALLEHEDIDRTVMIQILGEPIERELHARRVSLD